MLIPHGPLHHVPFAALADAQQRALIDCAGEITVGPSATVLLQVLPGRRSAAAGGCLALGYDGGERGLGHTEAEARAVARLFGSRPWIAGPGMRARLLAEAGSYRYLHLACHGEFEADDPLASWLEVGPGERLTAAEVLAQARLDAALVVLSACRSGVSRVLSGDETIGLARAFLAAGAGAVLVTLWPVEDTSARLLMEYLYGELARGQGQLSPPAALVRAQQFLRTLSRDEAHARLGAERPPETLPAYDDPRFWAAYVMIGAG
jgi:CHAT domain-containing protein